MVFAKSPKLVHTRGNIEPQPMRVRMLTFAKMTVHVIVIVMNIDHPKVACGYFMIQWFPEAQLIRLVMVDPDALG